MDDVTGKKVYEPDNIVWQFREKESDDAPWGPHKTPVNIEIPGIKISLEQRATGFLYRRQSAEGTIEKLVLTKKGQVFMSPVEPMHKPVKVSSHILIDFKWPVIVEPQSTKSIFVSFPLEIAIAVGRRESEENIIDIFTTCKSKHTLYGTVKDGLICKYWQSDVYESFPDFDPMELGVMQIEIQNPTANWAEVRKAVFSAQGMKIYFGPQQVTLNALMKIISESDAETSFIDSPLKAGLKPAFEQFSTRLLTQQGKTLMEEGY
ncbi:MAG: DUF432 domain-containing protein [Bacillota bacterium]|nr:DUF432 domain-containing protein [Bacillota bacterium]